MKFIKLTSKNGEAFYVKAEIIEQVFLCEGETTIELSNFDWKVAKETPEEVIAQIDALEHRHNEKIDCGATTPAPAKLKDFRFVVSDDGTTKDWDSLSYEEKVDSAAVELELVPGQYDESRAIFSVEYLDNSWIYDVVHGAEICHIGGKVIGVKEPKAAILKMMTDAKNDMMEKIKKEKEPEQFSSGDSGMSDNASTTVQASTVRILCRAAQHSERERIIALLNVISGWPTRTPEDKELIAKLMATIRSTGEDADEMFDDLAEKQ